MKTSAPNPTEATESSDGEKPLVQSDDYAQGAPDANEEFDRAREGAPRAEDKEQYRGQSGYGGLAASNPHTEHEASEHRTLAPGQRGAFGEGNYGGELGQSERGGVSSYGNSSGSRYSIDNQPGSSSRTLEPSSSPGAAQGAAAVSTNLGQYAGEYDDGSHDKGDDKLQPARELPHHGAASVATAQQASPESSPDDLRLQDTIGARLAEHPNLELRDVSVAVANKTVRLEGSVPERRMKHAIEDVADNVDGVVEIDNRIKVRRPEEAVATFASGYSAGQAYANASENPDQTGPATFGVASAQAAVKKKSKDQDGK